MNTHEWVQTGWEYDDSFFRCGKCGAETHRKRGIPEPTDHLPCIEVEMGLYNTYGSSCQLKVGNDLQCKHFNVGDEVDIPDGVYIAFEGAVVILNGKLAAVFSSITDKWGSKLDCRDIIDDRNPIKQALLELKDGQQLPQD